MNNLLMNQIKLNGILGLSILGCGFLSYNQYIKEQKFKQKMMMLNGWPFHEEILKYICAKYGDEINSFNYSVEKIYHFNEFRFRRKETPLDYKVLQPNDCEITIIYRGEPIDIKFEIVKDHRGNPVKFLTQDGCSSSEEFVTKLELSASAKKLLTDFADEAKEWSALHSLASSAKSVSSFLAEALNSNFVTNSSDEEHPSCVKNLTGFPL